MFYLFNMINYASSIQIGHNYCKYDKIIKLKIPTRLITPNIKYSKDEIPINNKYYILYFPLYRVVIQ